MSFGNADIEEDCERISIARRTGFRLLASDNPKTTRIAQGLPKLKIPECEGKGVESAESIASIDLAL